MKGLKYCLRRAGMKQRALAAALGVSGAVVSGWITGAFWPRAEMLPRIAEILGCSTDDLFKDYTQEEDDTP